MTAKNRVTINLEDDEYQALQRVAEETDRSLAWLGRRAVCDFLASQEGRGEMSPSKKPFDAPPAGPGAQ